MANSTYSFADYNISIASPMGIYSVQGEGIGDITTSRSTTKSVHSVGADGSVMTSKVAGKNGTFAINCQQTSQLNNWLQKLFNLLEVSPSNLWTSIAVTVSNNVQGEVAVFTGVSFENQAQKSMAAEGAMRSWSMLAQNYIETAL
jgi:hypothetical protein